MLFIERTHKLATIVMNICIIVFLVGAISVGLQSIFLPEGNLNDWKFFTYYPILIGTTGTIMTIPVLGTLRLIISKKKRQEEERS
jgi:hypothetical protein